MSRGKLLSEKISISANSTVTIFGMASKEMDYNNAIIVPTKKSV